MQSGHITKSFSRTIDSTRRTPAVTYSARFVAFSDPTAVKMPPAAMSGKIRELVCSRHPCGYSASHSIAFASSPTGESNTRYELQPSAFAMSFIPCAPKPGTRSLKPETSLHATAGRTGR